MVALQKKNQYQAPYLLRKASFYMYLVLDQNFITATILGLLTIVLKSQSSILFYWCAFYWIYIKV